MYKRKATAHIFNIDNDLPIYVFLCSCDFYKKCWKVLSSTHFLKFDQMTKHLCLAKNFSNPIHKLWSILPICLTKYSVNLSFSPSSLICLSNYKQIYMPFLICSWIISNFSLFHTTSFLSSSKPISVPPFFFIQDVQNSCASILQMSKINCVKDSLTI